MLRASLFTALAATVTLLAGPAATQEGEWRHATSLVGTPKYAEGFDRFDYVNPDAPKGGRVRLSVLGTFDSLNAVPEEGTSGIAAGLIYDTLMTSSFDEVSTEYGLLAEAMRYPDDYASVTYHLRDDAAWHDGTPITVDDVVFSFNALVEHNASQAFYYQHVKGVEITGQREVTFTFDETGNRELPQIVGQLLILPKHWWEGTDANGNPRDISGTTLEIPLGSGAYRITSVSPGRTIVYQRVDDYWARDLNVNIGANNLDEIRYEFFRDETVELEAFKGDQVDWRDEPTARLWATAYDVPAVRDGRIIMERFPQTYNASGLMVGFIFNLDRAPFDDQRVRRAFNLVFPFESLNESIFYGEYERIDSYYFGLPFASSGLPEGRELEMLEEVRDIVPESVFTTEYTNPVNTPETERTNLREAIGLLRDAGFTLDGNRLLGPDGRQLTVEYLMNGPRFETIGLRYQAALEKIGIRMELRPVDSSQYVNRIRSRDFDIIYTGWAQSMSLGNEQIEFFGSESADRDGSRNYGGIEDAGVDALIRRILQAPDRDDLLAASAALDRVLLANDFIVPGWTQRTARIARWDRYAHPDPLPEFSVGFPTIWWWDEEKAAAVEAKQ